MKKINVIQLIDSLNVGGAETLAVNIANGLAEQGVDSFICATRKEGLLKNRIDSNVPYLFLNRKKQIDIKAIFKLKKYVIDNQIQIIHAHGTSYFIAICLKMVYPKIKIVWHNHNGGIIHSSTFKVLYLIFFSRWFHYSIHVSKELLDWGINKVNLNKSSYIANFPFFSKQKDKTTVLKGVEDKRIVHLARFVEEKDHLNLLNSFLQLHKKYPDWTLHLIGKDYENAYSLAIRKFIKENQLENKVFLYGVQSDIEHILSQATMGVLSSNSEGLPIALLEYGLAKIPAVVTNVGECMQVVNNTDVVVEKENSDLLANALEKLINSEELRKDLAEKLHQNVKDNYSKEKVIKKLINIYSNL